MVPKDRCADAEVEAHIACFGMLIEAGADPFLESATAEGDTDTAFSIALLKGAGSSLYSVACDIAKRDVSGDLAFLQMVHRGEVGGVRAELKKSTCARRTHLLNKTDGNCSTIILAVLSGEQAMLKLLLSEEYAPLRSPLHDSSDQPTTANPHHTLFSRHATLRGESDFFFSTAALAVWS